MAAQTENTQPETVLVTGVTRGIGAQILAQLLARDNTRVIAGVRSLDSAPSKKLIEKSASNKNLIVVKLDSESDTDAQDAAARIQSEHGIDRVDVVILNAGIATDFSPVLEVKAADVRQTMNVNLVSAILLFQAFEPLLARSANARVIFVSTAIASLALQRSLPYKGTSYGSSKAALNFLASRVAIEHPNITAVAVHPGLVQTDMAAVAMDAIGGDIEKAVEGGDAITPEASARAILKLADEATNETHSGKFFHAPAGTELPW
ncbi:aflatoxin biosynthesis ketoreductase nor-1 [Xylariales sp. PMI_506]|nr:aflatoxin biosynthesis ketoreductase nor-1 [Xylariales sp. PMI_506]